MGSKFKTLLENENLEKIKNISKVLKSSKSVVLSRCSYESWSTWLYRHWGSRLHLIALISYLFILGFSHSIKCNSDGLIEPYKQKLTNKLCYLNGTFRYTCDGLLTIPRMEEGYTERCSLQEEPERLWKYTYFKRLLFIQLAIVGSVNIICYVLKMHAKATFTKDFTDDDHFAVQMVSLRRVIVSILNNRLSMATLVIVHLLFSVIPIAAIYNSILIMDSYTDGRFWLYGWNAFQYHILKSNHFINDPLLEVSIPIVGQMLNL
ncbi:hypothetical protein TYRP_001976 [Tyrophagus putrescentiae]|nr:hypothetical protein TYRP_001976 [Tyrophagus putrescentiae]